MNSLYVKASVACYFRYTRQNPIVAFERSLENYHHNNPDILTINEQRYLIEIEVKVSISDMKNDALKSTWNKRTKCPDLYSMPYQFYYAVPEELKDKAITILNQWNQENKLCGKTGLLTITEASKSKYLGSDNVTITRKAPINKLAKRLSVKQVIQMVKHQTGTLCSLAVSEAKNQLPNKDIIEYYI